MRVVIHNHYGTRDDAGGFSENEHPRGQPKNAGQFAPKGGGGSGSKSSKRKERREGSSNVPKEERGKSETTYQAGGLPQATTTWKGNTDPKKTMSCCKSEGKEAADPTAQPVKHLDELYEKSKEAEKGFKDDMDAIAQATKGSISYTPAEYAEPGTILKKRSSAERKLSSELGGDASQLKDVVRATVLHNDWRETRSAAVEFIKSKGDAIVRVKDRIAEPLAGGYRDMLINYRLPNGIVAEVQFNTPAMLEVKNGEGHKLYEQQRELAPAGRAVSPEVLKQVQELDDKMTQMYAGADQASGNGQWKQAA